MAVIARKQLTGSTQKIKEYAGHEGQLVFDKQTKHLHVLSGTAGQTTELANKSDIPAPVDISGKADKTYVDQQLATKEAKGTAYSKVESDGKYATKTELNNIPKTAPVVFDSGKPLTNIHQSNSGNHPLEDILVFASQTESGSSEEGYNVYTEQASDNIFIPKNGDRGTLVGWETYTQLDDYTNVYKNTPDFVRISGSFIVDPPDNEEVYTKVVAWYTHGGDSITLPQGGGWIGGTPPDLSKAGHYIVVIQSTKFPGIVASAQYYYPDK